MLECTIFIYGKQKKFSSNAKDKTDITKRYKKQVNQKKIILIFFIISKSHWLKVHLHDLKRHLFDF